MLADPLPLKTGVLQYAFEYKHAVQCVVTANKEAICNEKTLSISRNEPVVTCCSAVLDPADFASYEEFVKKVREAYVDTWQLAYGTRPQDAEPYEPPLGNPAPKYEDAPEINRLNVVRGVVVLFAALAFLGPVLRR